MRIVEAIMEHAEVKWSGKLVTCMTEPWGIPLMASAVWDRVPLTFA